MLIHVPSNVDKSVSAIKNRKKVKKNANQVATGKWYGSKKRLYNNNDDDGDFFVRKITSSSSFFQIQNRQPRNTVLFYILELPKHLKKFTKKTELVVIC